MVNKTLEELRISENTVTLKKISPSVRQNCDIPISTIQYIGSKTKLAHFITKFFQGPTILDLMAGSHAIGLAAKHKFQVIANDVMYYSYIIGKAYLQSNMKMVYRLV